VKRFEFWRWWLIVLGLIMMAFGAVLLLPALFGVGFSYINTAFWESGAAPEDVKPFYEWILGIYAAMVLAWALFIVLAARYPFRRREKWSWYCLLASVSIWFLVDTLVCLAFGVYTNAANNLFVYVVFLIPLLATRKGFS
jgi:hypothetical protein